MLSNMGMEQREEEKEVTEEEDPLKYFSQQQKKKKKEEEAKRYLKPILEEEDPLKYFDKNAEKLAEDEDPEKFLKQKEERPSDDLPKLMGKMLSLGYNEQDLANKILENDIPQEIELEKKKVELKYSYDERRKKMEKRAKTSFLIFSATSTASTDLIPGRTRINSSPPNLPAEASPYLEPDTAATVFNISANDLSTSSPAA